MSRDHVFNSRRIRLKRTRIPKSENTWVVLILFALIVLVAWVMTTRNNFDPMERDLPIDLQGDNSLEIEIYTRPLKLWVEPGQQITATAFDLGPFPNSTLDTEWQPVGRLRRFQADNLYEKINGEAEKFIKQGFVELAYLRLRSSSDGSEIAIELFDQGDLGGSLGIFADHTAGRALDNRDGVSFIFTEAGAIGRKEHYFFRIVGDSQSTAITDKAASLVKAFSHLGSDHSAANPRNPDVPAGFALLNERLGIAETDIQFQENNVFQYDFAQRFWFGNAGSVGDARLFVHIADTPAKAEKLLTALAEEHSYEYDRMQSDYAYTLFRHRYLGTYFAVARRGRHLFGVEKSPNAAALPELLERISEVLRDDES